MLLLFAACVLDEEIDHDDIPSAGGKADEWQCEDASWQRKTVARVQAVKTAFSFAVNGAGEPRLVFADPAKGVLGAYRTATGEWASQMLAPPSYSHELALAIAPSGRAHTCYLQPPTLTSSTKILACRDASGASPWGPEVVVKPPGPGLGAFFAMTNLAVGPDGSLLLGVTGANWTERPDRPGQRFDVWGFSQVAYRGPDRSRFSFAEPMIKTQYNDRISDAVVAIGPDLRHHAFMSGSYAAHYQREDFEAEWEETRDQGYFVQPNELVADARGRLWMVSASGNEVVVLSMDPARESDWTREVVGIAPSRQQRPIYEQQSNTGLAIDSKGVVHVVAVASDASPVHAVRRGENDWELERIDVENVDAVGPRIAIDAQDNVHVAYFDRALSRLIYARRSCSE